MHVNRYNLSTWFIVVQRKLIAVKIRREWWQVRSLSGASLESIERNTVFLHFLETLQFHFYHTD